MTYFGCTNSGNEWKALDKTTNGIWCGRSGLHGTPVGLIISPGHSQMTIPEALRLYTSAGCYSCDPLSFVLEGRVDPNSSWVEIGSSEIPDIANYPDRNPGGLPIVSTYESGDTNHTFKTVHFHGQGAAYLEYKITFEIKVETSGSLQFAEIEMPGMLIPSNPVQVNTIFDVGSPVTNYGCLNTHRNKFSVDGLTTKYFCDRNGLDGSNGIIISPSHSLMSIAKKLRVYAQNNCKPCDPVSYVLHGRVDSSSALVDVAEGDFDWIDSAPSRNGNGLQISSTYESGDINHSFTEVQLDTNNAAYLEYKLEFVSRVASYRYLQFGEVELPGLLLPNV